MSKQLNKLCDLSILSEIQDKKSLHADIDKLRAELTDLLNTCDTLQKTLN